MRNDLHQLSNVIQIPPRERRPLPLPAPPDEPELEPRPPALDSTSFLLGMMAGVLMLAIVLLVVWSRR